MARWAPPNERGKFASALLGHTIGTAFIWVYINYTIPKLGWQASFYVNTILVMVYCIAFFFLTSSSPEQHKFISPEELEHIKKSQGPFISIKKEMPPYGEILSSCSCFALAILQFGDRWLDQMNIFVVPTYMNDFVGVDTDASALLTVLPLLFEYLGAVIFANLTDIIAAKNTISVTALTKMFVVVSHLVPGMIILCTGLTQCVMGASAILLVLSNFFGGAVVVTNLRIPVDMAPNFSATIFSLHSVLSSTSGLIVPSLSEVVIGDANDVIHWAILFAVGGLVLISTGIIYIFFGSSEIQYWNVKRGRPLRLRRNDEET
ncbi:sodium-dependent phosphate transport protein 1-like isoform X2 [Sitophilus oryzae]|nr:sodium-dependent phosphate transport protein 1-like isoform X2 [Sitophilus oryzae]